jgi:hypothetical protein
MERILAALKEVGATAKSTVNTVETGGKGYAYACCCTCCPCTKELEVYPAIGGNTNIRFDVTGS